MDNSKKTRTLILIASCHFLVMSIAITLIGLIGGLGYGFSNDEGAKRAWGIAFYVWAALDVPNSLVLFVVATNPNLVQSALSNWLLWITQAITSVLWAFVILKIASRIKLLRNSSLKI